MVYVTRPRLFQGWFTFHGLALAASDLSTKYEAFISTQYEDMKSDTKCQKWGGLGEFGSFVVT